MEKAPPFCECWVFSPTDGFVLSPLLTIPCSDLVYVVVFKSLAPLKADIVCLFRNLWFLYGFTFHEGKIIRKKLKQTKNLLSVMKHIKNQGLVVLFSFFNSFFVHYKFCGDSCLPQASVQPIMAAQMHLLMEQIVSASK